VIVLDSSFLIAFHNPNDAHHRAASVVMERFLGGEWGKGLLLEYVFLEVVTVIMLRLDLAAAVRTGRILPEAEELEFAPCSDFFLETLDGFSRQSGTRLSFVDAALAHAARTRADGQILTFDAEFRKLPLAARPKPLKSLCIRLCGVQTQWGDRPLVQSTRAGKRCQRAAKAPGIVRRFC
jgi:predicted nucleic acid-binding protein